MSCLCPVIMLRTFIIIIEETNCWRKLAPFNMLNLHGICVFHNLEFICILFSLHVRVAFILSVHLVRLGLLSSLRTFVMNSHTSHWHIFQQRIFDKSSGHGFSLYPIFLDFYSSSFSFPPILQQYEFPRCISFWAGFIPFPKFKQYHYRQGSYLCSYLFTRVTHFVYSVLHISIFLTWGYSLFLNWTGFLYFEGSSFRARHQHFPKVLSNNAILNCHSQNFSISPRRVESIN